MVVQEHAGIRHGVIVNNTIIIGIVSLKIRAAIGRLFGLTCGNKKIA
jgi:hypothetical protein